MCGRFVTPEEAAIERAVEVGRRRGQVWKPSYNVAPTMAVPVLLGDTEPGYTLDSARWGFVPHWWKKDEAPRASINARVESLADKPMWRDAFAGARCLIPALGWYEWAQREHIDTDTGEVRTLKQPYFLHGADSGVLLFAGLYSERADERTGTALSVAIITCPARGEAASIHDRMPVVLDEDTGARWTDPEAHERQTLQGVLAGHRHDAIGIRPVSRRVNSPRNDDARLIEAVEDVPPQTDGPPPARTNRR